MCLISLKEKNRTRGLTAVGNTIFKTSASRKLNKIHTFANHYIMFSLLKVNPPIVYFLQ